MNDVQRRRLILCGRVQSVGMRPFIWRLATHHTLGGFVRNEGGAVILEIEGPSQSLENFSVELAKSAPPLAHIADLRCDIIPPRGDRDFQIEPSQVSRRSDCFICPDVCTCAECVSELFDPANRRYRYPFINCTHCGPRLTIIRRMPYDRNNTTMAAFEMCARCRSEYEDPRDRRFHAQPIGCRDCGPRLCLRDKMGRDMSSDDPLRDASILLHKGEIGAIKGLGGYHLACSAENDSAVQNLRRKKGRDDKAFALMVRDIAAARELCETSSAEETILTSLSRPIVILTRKGSAQIAAAVAPGGNPSLGIMLPYTPVHYLLMDALGKSALVMTSANLSDEPIVYDDTDAFLKLNHVADFFLTHDRAIEVRCDDSVCRMIGGRTVLIRRARGFAPEPVLLPQSCSRPILAVGAQLKSTFALVRGQDAILSHHLGDLDSYESWCAFESTLHHYQRLFAIAPELVVHDLHPDYGSTRFAFQEAQRLGVQRLGVQHHHAHMASAMAENKLHGQVIGVIFDGSGLGTDGTIWGGEFLVGEYMRFVRAAHLREVRMPGGEEAIREPWRMALSYLLDAGENIESIIRRFPAQASIVKSMLRRGFNSPLTSSCGRFFDAAAAIIGIRDRVTYEGQAAVELEWEALKTSSVECYPFELAQGVCPEIDTRPVIRGIVKDQRDGVSKTRIARRFHSTIVNVVVEVCGRIRDQFNLERVVLSGGVFMNTILLSESCGALSAAGFKVFTQNLVPANDGGISLGQVAIAAAHSFEGR